MKKIIYFVFIMTSVVAIFIGCSEKKEQDYSFNIPTITAGAPAENLQQFEYRLDSLRLEMNIPAISAAIVKNRQIVWAKGFGYADLKNKRQATPHTSFQLASITKSFAATIIMQLVEEGVLDLETPVSEFGIELESEDIVRVKHLFNHTSKGNPGTIFDYDGGRYSLLDQVIAEASGRSFGELLYERIVKPLNLTDTAPNLWDTESFKFWGIDQAEFEQNMAKAYWEDGKTHVPYEIYFGTAAGLFSSAIDVAKFSIAIDNQTFLSEENQAVLFSPSIYISNNTTAYGFGWFIQEYNGVTILWHGGCWTGASCFLVKIPEEELAFIILANTRMLQVAYPQIRNDGDVTRSAVVLEFLNAFVFGNARLPDEPVNWENIIY